MHATRPPFAIRMTRARRKTARGLWILAAVVAPLWAAPHAYSLAFDRYHTLEEINGYMRDVASNRPDLVDFHTLGRSAENRGIHYLVLSEADPATVPAIYMNGTHHGDEKSSTEAVLGLIDYLVTHARKNEDVQQLLKNYAVYVQPVVNPDGHVRHTRGDSKGRDPNRDYAYPGRSKGRSFRIPAIQNVRKLADRVRFRAAAAYHSGMEGVLWPWCHTAESPQPLALFHTLAKISAKAMGMSHYAQSYDDYPTRGEFIDYVFMAHDTIALTFEVSRKPTPEKKKLAKIVEKSVVGAMTFMLGVMEHDQGILTVEPAPTGPQGERLAQAQETDRRVESQALSPDR